MLLGIRDHRTHSNASDFSPPRSPRGSRLSVQLVRASVVRERIRDPIQMLQRLRNRAMNRQTPSFGTNIRGFIRHSHANLSSCTSADELVTRGRNSPHFERQTMNFGDAIHRHKAIEFRQRFLALPGEIRNQIYDEVISAHQGKRPQIPEFHSPSDPFLYTGTIDGASGWTINLRSVHPRPGYLQYVRDGDHIWRELLDRWLAGAECELFQSIDIGYNKATNKSCESMNVLPRASLSMFDHHVSEGSELFPWDRLDFFADRWVGTCTLTLAIFSVDLNFAQAARQVKSSPLFKTINHLAFSLRHALQTEDLRIKIDLWPGEYMDTGFHGWHALFECDADIEGMWTLLAALKSLPGIQSIGVRRLRGNALWSKKPNSLYPGNYPLVVLESSCVSMDRWLNLD